jgi:actin related protein 2/3 complex subunit 2
MAAPFEKAIDEHHRLAEASKGFNPENVPTGDGSEVMVIRYRDEEAMYIQASHDRVTVIFSTVFREETDRIFGKVFLSEFVDARRRAIQNAPQVLYRNDPPLEIRGVPGLKDDGTGDVGYITFGIYPPMLVHVAIITNRPCDSSVPPPSHCTKTRRVDIAYPDLP